ncbi:MAG: GNAT family N-acetyltransferase [Clostridiales bacterium]
MKIIYKDEVPKLEDYINLRKSVNWTVISERNMEISLKSTLYSITANYKDKFIGMGRIIGDGGYYFIIVDIIVLPEYQGRGIGENIMKSVMNWIKDNCEKSSAVWLMATKGKEEFYKKFGFETRPIENHGCGMQLKD